MSEEVTNVKPIGEIKLDIGDVSLIFNPKEDITPKEVALIFQMFLNSILNPNELYFDFGGYMEKHDLKKHFVQITTVSDSDTVKQ